MSSWTPHDAEMDYMLAELENHYDRNCKRCMNYRYSCGNPLSISGYKNCLEFGLFVLLGQHQ